MNHRACRKFVGLAALVFLGGCVLDLGAISTGTGGSTGTSSSSGSSSSSSGNTGGSGGGEGGSGGQAGGIGVGGGGGSGGSSCIDGTGMKDVLACDTLNTKGVLCGPNNDVSALANDVCVRGAAIYTGISFDTLHSCLQTIEKVDACLDQPVKDCVTEMYKSACPNAPAAKACDDLANITCKGEPFDSQGCLLDTLPLNEKALQVLANCIADTDPNMITCQAAYFDCLDKLTAFCDPIDPTCVPLRAPRPDTY